MEKMLPAPEKGCALHMASEHAVVLHEDDWAALQEYVGFHLHKAGHHTLDGLTTLQVKALKVAEVVQQEEEVE